MPEFKYSAVDKLGIRVRATAEAPSQKDLADMLSKSGFTLISAESKEQKTKTSHLRVRRNDLIDLTHNIVILETSGVPLFEGLTDLAEQVENPQMKIVLNEIVADVARGHSLSDSMERFPNVFPHYYIHVVRAGEQSGALDHVLSRLADFLQWKASIQGLVRQMLIYPTILFSAVCGLVFFLLIWLIPRLMGVFQSTNVELPAPTKFLINLGDFLQAHWLLVIGSLFGSIIGLIVLKKQPKGKLFLDNLILQVPIIGVVIRKVAAAQFSATLATLYRAGVDLERAMEITGSTIDNSVMSRAIHQARERILAGIPLSEAIRGTRQFQPLVTRMIAIGEKAGRLEEALGKVVSFYDREVPAAVKRFMAVVEPAITIFAGFVVGFIVLASLLPIFKLYETMRR